MVDLPVARLPQGDVSGAVISRMFELDEPGADPILAELRRSDLEVQVCLAARFCDLAPGGSDLVTLAVACINPMIWGVFGDFIDRNDGQLGGNVEGFENAGENAVVELGEGSEGDSHDKLSLR